MSWDLHTVFEVSQEVPQKKTSFFSDSQTFYALLTTAIITMGGYVWNEYIKNGFQISPKRSTLIHVPNWDLTDTTQAWFYLALGWLAKSTANFNVQNTVSPEAEIVLSVCTQSENIMQWCNKTGIEVMY